MYYCGGSYTVNLKAKYRIPNYKNFNIPEKLKETSS